MAAVASDFRLALLHQMLSWKSKALVKVRARLPGQLKEINRRD